MRFPANAGVISRSLTKVEEYQMCSLSMQE